MFRSMTAFGRARETVNGKETTLLTYNQYEFKNVEENATIHKLFALINEVQENELIKATNALDKQTNKKSSALDVVSVFNISNLFSRDVPLNPSSAYMPTLVQFGCRLKYL